VAAGSPVTAALNLGGPNVPILHFTGHARDRLRLYHLREDDIAEALAHADRRVDEGPQRPHIWRRRGDRWLRVTFVAGQRVVTIIAVEMLPTGPPDLEEADAGQEPPKRPPPSDLET